MSMFTRKARAKHRGRTRPEATVDKHRPSLWLMSLLMIAVASTFSFVTPSEAATTRQAGIATYVTYLGIEAVDGVPTVCINSGAAQPTYLPSGTRRNDPRIAYLLDKYLSTNDDITAAALAYIVKKAYDADAGAADDALNQTGSREAAVRDRIADLNADATAHAGPYELAPDLNATPGVIPTKGTVTDIGVRQLDGTYVAIPGSTITVTLSGPAVFDSTGTNTRTFSATSSGQTAAWHATGNGEVSVSATATNVPSDSFIIYPPQSAGYQRMAGAVPNVTLRGGDPIAVPTVTIYQPKVATQIQSSTELGAERCVPVNDRVKVTDAKPGATVPVTVRYYWSATKPSESATVPAGAELLGSYTVDVTIGADGTGTAVAPGPCVEQLYGWVSATESVPEVAGISKAYESNYGVSTETTIVPQRPLVLTQIQSSTELGAERCVPVNDQVEVSKAAPNSSVTVEVTYYWSATKPVEAASVPADAVKLGTFPVAVSTDGAGSGTATANGPCVKQDYGYVSAVESIPASAGFIGYTSNYGVNTETTVVPSRPVVSTQIQTSTVLGEERCVPVTDEVLVEHAEPNTTVPVTVRFYWEATKPGQSVFAPDTATKVGEVTVDVKVGADGTGTATAQGPCVTQTYGWVSATEHIAEAGTVLGYDSEYGVSTETTAVPSRPVATTEIQAQPLAEGSIVDLKDSVLVTGAEPNTTVSVVVDFYLDTVKPVEAEVAPETATKVGTVTVEVKVGEDGTGTAVASLPGIKIEQSTWAIGVESIPAVDAIEAVVDDAATTDVDETAPYHNEVLAYQAPYGQVTESMQVCTPQVTTLINQQDLNGGKTVKLTDKVFVTKACANSEVPVVVDFYIDSATPVLGDDVPASAKKVGTATITVKTDANGVGTAVAQGPEVLAPSEDTIFAVGHERIEARNGDVETPALQPYQSKYGVADETTSIKPRPKGVDVNAGMPVTDEGHPLFAVLAGLLFALALVGGASLTVVKVRSKK